MEQTDNRSASRIPKVLVLSTMILVFTRLAVFGMETHFKKGSVDAKANIEWLDLTESFRDRLKGISPKSSPEGTKSKTPTQLCSNCKTKIKSALNIENKKKESADILAEETKSIIKRSEGANKYVLFEFYSKESSPCRRMDQTSFGNTQVANLLKQNFTPVRVTYNRNESKTVGDSLVDFRRHYKVFAFPTLVVVDQKGEMVTNLVGNCSSLTTYRYLSRTISKLKATENSKKIASNKS